MADDDDYRFRPLEPPENGEFRDIRDGWKFRRRLYGNVNKTMVWITAAIAFVAAAHEWLGKLLTWLASLAGGPPA